MIFQEPMASFAPAITIGKQMVEQLQLHGDMSKARAKEISVEMLDRVGISDPSKRFDQYAFELSGGMRQRAMIAMAMVAKPDLLIADEPTTALDATVQAQIFDLLQDLQRDMGTAIIMITHDMGAIAELADQVAVMYAGRVVEQGRVETVLSAPEHPYTRGLIDCVPHLEPEPSPERLELLEIPGVVPALTELNKGCAFAPRCSQKLNGCDMNKPELQASEEGHLSACWAVHGGLPA